MPATPARHADSKPEEPQTTLSSRGWLKDFWGYVTPEHEFAITSRTTTPAIRGLAKLGRPASRETELRWSLDADQLAGLAREQENPFSARLRVVLQDALTGPTIERLLRSDVERYSVQLVGERIDRLETRVSELIADLKSRPERSNASIVDLNNDGLVLLQPLMIVIEQYADEVTATWPEVEAFGSGASPSEAILSLKKDIGALYFDLESAQEEELGTLALAWKRTLGRVIVPNGTARRQAT